jgi:thiosulfate/3-mercaptopyruvate sulfurtransferase
MRRRITLFAVIVAGLAFAPVAALAGPSVTPLVSTDWLEANLGAPDLVILDIRSQSEFESGHIPGSQRTAYPSDWTTERDGIPSRIPETADLEAFLSSIGIGPDVSVVVVPSGTDASELGGATWIYWVLKYLGHDAVAILDGGWAAWDWEHRPVEQGAVPSPEPKAFVASPRPEILAEVDYVVSQLDTDTVIIDARPGNQYTGVVQSPLTVRAGHIPGAINLPYANFYDDLFGKLKSVDELEAVLPPELSDRTVKIIVYCNAGHWSSIDWFVLHELLGFDNTRLYEASMAGWSRNPDLPLVTGPDP